MIPLHRLMYVSRATCPSSQTLLGLSEILAEADRNNRRDRLTGLLLAHDGWFLQVLEGPRGPIDRLLRDLRADPRHADIRVLEDVTVAERDFGGWTMGHARITPEVAPLLAAISLGRLGVDEARGLLARASGQLDRVAA